MNWDLIVTTWKADLHANVAFYLLGTFVWGFLFGLKVQTWMHQQDIKFKAQMEHLEAEAGRLVWRAKGILRHLRRKK